MIDLRTAIYGDGTCALDTCDVPAGHNQLLCREHWFDVPPSIRGDLVMAWHRYHRHYVDEREVLRVQQLAIKAVTR
jgi:hypothetical protein